MASPASHASRTPENSSPASASTAAAGPTNRPAVDVTAITTRDDFLLELGEALSGQAGVRPVDSISAALEQITSARRAQILVLDTRDSSDVRADVERAHAQAPHAVVLVFATTELEKQLGGSLKGSHVFAVLPLPVEARKTAAVLEGAVAEAASRKVARAAEPTPPVTVEPFHTQSSPAGASAAAGPKGSDPKSNKIVFIGVGVVVAAIAAGALFFLNRGNKETASAPAPASVEPTAPHPTAQSPSEEDNQVAQPAVDTSIINGKVDELLEKARLAMRERRYTEPTGDNALVYYRSAAAADSSNGEAADGLQRVAGVLATRFDESLNAGRLDEANGALANFKSAAPNDSRTGPFELRLMTALISKAFVDGNLDRAAALIRQASQSPSIPADQIAKWRAEMNRHQEDAKVQRVAGLVTDRIRDGRLIEPADDSAKFYLQQLHELAPANATTLRQVHDLNAAYLHKAREAALANRTPEVDKWLAEAKAGGVSAAEISAFQRDLSSSRLKAVAAESERLAQLVRDRSRDGRLGEPPQDSAAFYLTQMQSSDPSNPVLAQLSRDLASRFLERARGEAQGGKSALADADLGQAKHWGADPKDILVVQNIGSASGTPSSAVSRTSAALAVNTTTLAATLKKTRYVQPEYPSKALVDKVTGSVTVEFVVDTKGEPRDVRVIESSPPGVFDRAATTAVKRWHWESPPVEVPIRTAIRFELPK